ncbi:MAG: DMT family transporter [Desulfurococcaceae archaeon]
MEIMYPVIAAVIWSTNPAFIYKFARKASPVFFTFMRALMAVAFMWMLVVFNGGIHSNDLGFWQVLLLTLTGVIGPGIGDIAYTRAIQLLGGSLAIVLSYTYIFFAQFFSITLFNEEATYVTIIGGVLAFMGVAIATIGNGSVGAISKKGLIYSFVAAICWGLASALIRPLRDQVDAYTTALIRTSAVAVFSLLTSVILKEHREITKSFMVAAFFTGVLGWGIGMVLFVYSIYTIGVSATVVATALAPVLSQFVNRLIAGEKTSLKVLIGALLVATSIALQAI